MQNWNRQGFFFLSGTGRLCDEANQERNTAESRLDFISKCTSTSTDAFISLCFFCQCQLNYGGVLKCFVIAIWEWYIYMLPLTKNIFIFFLCHWALFVHTNPYFDGQLKSQLNSHQPLVWQFCPPLQWARIIEANRYRGQAVADLGVHVMLMKTTVQSIQKDIHLRNNLWTCYRIGNDCFFFIVAFTYLEDALMHFISPGDQNHGLGTTMLAELHELLNDNGAQKRLDVFSLSRLIDPLAFLNILQGLMYDACVMKL